MPLPFNRHYLYCPYGPVVSGQLLVISDQFIQILQKKFSDAVFIRVEPKYNLSLTLSLKGEGKMQKTKNIQPGKTLIIDLAKTEDELLADMHHKTRYNIRLAQKHGVEVKDEFYLVNGKGLLAKEAVELIAKTSQRQGYKAQSPDYFEKLISYFAIQNPQGHLKLHVYKALYNKQLLASAIIIDYGKTRTYLFGGSSDEFKNIMAPYLLHFQAMVDAKAVGLTEYDFWGIETSAGDTPGFVRFKLGFSTLENAIKKYAGAYDIIFKPFEYRLYGLLRAVNRVFKR
jgi:lipid II:glycine glycyltransferase (peptidoglycan interpeptide bridge formation enzyme)